MWVPVLWFAEWATSELVWEESWMLAKNKDIEYLESIMKEFFEKKWDRKVISETIRGKLEKYR
jgi:hypothetical protein